jgi:hypothetical protein
MMNDQTILRRIVREKERQTEVDGFEDRKVIKAQGEDEQAVRDTTTEW